MDILSAFGGQQAPQVLSTQQTDDSANRSMDASQTRGRGQSEYERQASYDDMVRDGAFKLLQDQRYASQVGNPIANSNAARTIAMNTAAELNRMYAGSADRLLRSSSDTRNALNQAAATVAGMFR